VVFDSKEFIVVARSLGALHPPPELWSKLVETNIIEHGQPLNGVVSCFHAIALHAFAEPHIRDSAQIMIAVDALLLRIRANMSTQGLREVQWTAFGFVQFPKHVHPQDHAALGDRILSLENSEATKGAPKEHVLSIIYAAANMSLQSQDLYPALVRIAAEHTFSVDEIARICVRFAMSRVSESAAPLVSAVVGQLKDAREMRGQHVGAVLHGLHKCGIIDNGVHEALVGSIIDRMRGREHRMETRHLAFAAAALGKSKAHRRLDVIRALVLELAKRSDWSTVAPPMLALLVPAHSAVASGAGSEAGRFVKHLEQAVLTMRPKDQWAIRKALSEFPIPRSGHVATLLDHSLEPPKPQSESERGNPSPAAESSGSGTSDAECSQTLSAVAAADLDRIVEELFRAALSRADDRAKALLSKLVSVKHTWSTMAFSTHVTFATALSRVSWARTALIADVVDRAVHHQDVFSATPQQICALIRAMGRVAIVRREWSAKLASLLCRSGVDTVNAQDRAATAAALIQQRYSSLAAFKLLLDPSSDGDASASVPTLIDAAMVHAHTASSDDDASRGAVDIRKRVASAPVNAITSPRLVVRSCVALEGLSSTTAETEPWILRLGNDQLGDRLSIADAKTLAFRTNLSALESRWPSTAEAVKASVVRTCRTRQLSTVPTHLLITTLAVALQMGCEEHVWRPIVEVLGAGNAAMLAAAKITGSSVPFTAAAAGLLRHESRHRSGDLRQALAALSGSLMDLVRKTLPSTLDNVDDMALVLEYVAPLSSDGSVRALEIIGRTTEALVRQSDEANSRIPPSLTGIRGILRAVASMPTTVAVVRDKAQLVDVACAELINRKRLVRENDVATAVCALWCAERTDLGVGPQFIEAFRGPLGVIASAPPPPGTKLIPAAQIAEQATPGKVAGLFADGGSKFKLHPSVLKHIASRSVEKHDRRGSGTRPSLAALFD
jgi:hypothetical protein